MTPSAVDTQIAFWVYPIVVPLTIGAQLTFLSLNAIYAGMTSEAKIKLRSRKATPLLGLNTVAIESLHSLAHSKTHCHATQVICEQTLDQQHFALQLLDMRTLCS